MLDKRIKVSNALRSHQLCFLNVVQVWYCSFDTCYPYINKVGSVKRGAK